VYENVFQLWTALGIQRFVGTIAVDLKLANILCGIMAHSSMFPCTWCYARKDKLNEIAELRTIGNILANYTNWCNAGRNKTKAKNFMNCIHPPAIGTDKDQRIIDIVTPPELHLMLGAVNTLYNHMLQKFGDQIVLWTRQCNVKPDVTQGGSGFNGNSCKTLLQKVDMLRAICSIECLPYVKVLDDLRLVVKSCFGEFLDPNFVVYLENFRKSYTDLGISVTPKIHAIFFHVKDFCIEKQKSLGLFSEQSMESVHFDFKLVWSKYKLNSDHSDYPRQLFRAVCEYNGLHL